MPTVTTLGEILQARGIGRRKFLQFCTGIATLLALPPAMIPRIAEALEKARRPSVIWLSFQECTGCTESLTRSHDPSLENLIFNAISLDYHHTLQAASGQGAEAARTQAIKDNYGKFLLVVDGSVPTANPGYSTIAGISNLDMLLEAAEGAFAVIAVGSCAAFGGIPHASPNPTGAVAISKALPGKKVINVPGCPPIATAITGVLAHFLTFGAIPELDHLGRPLVFYGQTVHDRCYRRPYYEKGWFARSFDDEGARKGWCLYLLGCKGPVTYNACPVTKWNQGTSYPIEAGHGCIGCSEPNFWDQGGFYRSLPQGQWGGAGTLTLAAGLGAAAGAGATLAARRRQNQAREESQ